MDIKVGEFIRSKTQGIKKIDAINENAPINRYKYKTGESDWDGEYYGTIKTTEIVKHSPNIIDLIEVGDIVEVFMEMDLDEEDTNIFEVVGITVDKDEIAIFNKDLEFDFVPVGNIRRILTQEKFKSVSYEVK